MEQERRCQNCKFWGREEDTYFPVNRDPENVNYKMCEITYGQYHSAYHQTLAFAVDAEGMSAYLFTAPNFGCIQHKRVDEE